MGSDEKFRVVIVDDIAETRENVRKLFQFEADIEVVGVARTGREGIEIARDTKPDVIIMDINMPDMDGINATEAIRRNVPFAQIIILSVQGDSNYMRRAMLAGARDFLTKPPSIDELMSAVRRAGAMARDERSKASITAQVIGTGTSMVAPRASLGKVLTVYSPKGGTGCTTVAVNLGITLHSEESPVILVDGKLQFGDVAVFLNVQSKNSIADLAPRAEELDIEIIQEVTVSHASSGIKILCAPSRPEHAEEITGNQFSKIVQFLRSMYAYVVIDISSTLTDATISALDISDLVLLLTTQEIPAIKNARLFLDIVDALNINRKRILFVMNRFDRRIGITPEKISESFKHEIISVLPFDEHLVVPSVNRGVPFMINEKSRSLAKAFLSLAEIIRQRLSELAEEVETEKAKPVAGRVRLFGR